jgi:hypothetical protein
MTCNKAGVIGKIYDRSQPALVKGSDFALTIQLQFKGSEEPATIAGFVGATGYFRKEDGSTLDKVGTLGSADLATVSFALPAEDTALLGAGDESSFEVGVEDDDGIRFFQFDGDLSIKDRIF